jgi:hypothetical protein
VDADTVRATRSGEDMETTLATPSSGVSPIHAGITPPSGALARVPAPSDRTPTSQSLSGARPPLELVNFRDPLADPANEETVRRSTDAPQRPTPAPAAAAKSRSSTIVAILAVIVAGVAAFMYVNGRNAPAPAPPPAALPTPAPAAVPTAALEFPEPSLGAGETATRATAPAPAPPAPPAEIVPTVPAPSEVKPEPPAAPANFRVQFSSVPLATLFVDGKKIGPSIPAKTISLAAGDHTVRMEAAGFPPYEKKFKVGAGGENRVHYQFPVSMLVIQAPGWAGARVLVDGKYQGTLPDASRLKLSPGTYNVTLSREGSNPITEKIEVPEGSPKTWNAPPPSPAAPGGP